jgi:hypothetical protein
LDIETAFSLADFINENSPKKNSSCNTDDPTQRPTQRYRAGVLEYGQVEKKGWVIVTEGDSSSAPIGNQSHRVNLEPIADVDDYLSRADRGIVQPDPEYYNLLHRWRQQAK